MPVLTMSRVPVIKSKSIGSKHSQLIDEEENLCGIELNGLYKKITKKISRFSKKARKRLQKWRGTTAFVVSWILIYIIIQTCKLLSSTDYLVCLAKLNRTLIRPHNVHSWQSIHDRRRDVLLYSAHYRPLGDSRAVHILAVGTGIPQELICLLWYADSFFPDVIKATTLNHDVDEVKKGRIVEQFFFTCACNSTQPPIYVSLTGPRCSVPTTFLQVQVPQKEEPVKEFGICMSSTNVNVHPYHIIEWMEAHQMFGIDEITLYYHTFSSNMSRVLNQYQKDGFVRLNYVSVPRRYGFWSDFKIISSLSLNDCMWKNMYRYHYIFILLNFDEIVIPRIHNNYSALLDYVDRTEGLVVPATSYLFQNTVFNLCAADTKDPAFSNFLRYLKRDPPSEEMRDFRSLVNPRYCLSLFTHYCHSFVSVEAMPWTVKVHQHVALTHHYHNVNKKKVNCDNMKKNLAVDRTVDRFRKPLSKRCENRIMQHKL
ncbi:Hypothetical predicted protein [Octopus vulgaris]|uniref:Uncharacterized protein n=2 Tax=Octopus TaxID=6643 RepID=A0AA36BJ63_OCTVU|nr:uncharacterized protein LOC106868966 [Octopus bimaculoides]XP_014769928.1 uncharacterized protein LOC106868966 [Octopus bimaculoides]XP_014769929.1 uncharacterized protein LOC106868966 [Octopus bimaculoides]XP_014769930.1 uncharacterized protein LOC106868966 [Octopus bimaculoides]XP_029646920.1 uncharacterized protein LOC115220875 isoform X2 [Octopus sinensis]XP_052829826.1 uncharacterized protein LOC106868966 [Octopus bimaculoides]XP_052829827.1 uncharacterized protein LOC106868966 [Octop|eukprot:XP_014769927.1 PREDICTED: uncharacterized protein LOC106868966 [Octopus bimaculoides]